MGTRTPEGSPTEAVTVALDKRIANEEINDERPWLVSQRNQSGASSSHQAVGETDESSEDLVELTRAT